MKHLLVILSLLGFEASQAQNIVANSNFALYSTCPDELHQITRAVGWYSPNISTPDYFNACNNGSTMSDFGGVPVNYAGYQKSFSNAYAAFLSFGDAEWREYFATDIPALQTGAVYKVTIKVSLSEVSQLQTVAPQVAFLLNEDVSSVPASSNIPKIPQIDFSSYGPVGDTDWVVFSKNFIADSAYTQLIVGNFKNTASSQVTVRDASARFPSAYYYVDSVAVEKIANSGLIQPSSGLAPVIYPNPFRGRATLSFSHTPGQRYCLYITNAVGVLEKKIENITTNEVTIDGHDLPAGFYMCKLIGDDEHVAYGKFIVN